MSINAPNPNECEILMIHVYHCKGKKMFSLNALNMAKVEVANTVDQDEMAHNGLTGHKIV